MRALRFAYWWLAGGVLLLTGVLYVTLAPGVRGPALVGDKLAHFTAFFGLMLWFSGIFRPGKYLHLALALAAFGIGIELLQAQLVYRTAEFDDAMFDFGGILLAWILARGGLGRWAEWIEAGMPQLRS